jgi:hypothetical protein
MFSAVEEYDLLEKFKTLNPHFLGFSNFLIYNAMQISVMFIKINPFLHLQ